MNAAPGVQRKRDLLLASQAARAQACIAFDELAARADAVQARVVLVGNLLISPAGLSVAAVLGVMMLRRTGRRLGPVRWFRWGWLAWRTWRRLRPLWRDELLRR